MDLNVMNVEELGMPLMGKDFIYKNLKDLQYGTI